MDLTKFISASFKEKILNVFLLGEQIIVITHNNIFSIPIEYRSNRYGKIGEIYGGIKDTTLIGKNIFILDNNNKLWIMSKEGIRELDIRFEDTYIICKNNVLNNYIFLLGENIFSINLENLSVKKLFPIFERKNYCEILDKDKILLADEWNIFISTLDGKNILLKSFGELIIYTKAIIYEDKKHILVFQGNGELNLFNLNGKMVCRENISTTPFGEISLIGVKNGLHIFLCSNRNILNLIRFCAGNLEKKIFEEIKCNSTKLLKYKDQYLLAIIDGKNLTIYKIKEV